MSKVAVVTGADSGIGKSTTLALLSNGYSVVAAGRRRAKLDELKLEADADGRLLLVTTNVSDERQVKELFRQTVSIFHRVDLLFNNAGAGAPAIPLEQISIQQWEKVLATNLTGAFLCTREAVKIMKKQSPRGGRIINNGSVSAHTPRPFSAPYTTSKHGLTGLTKSTALDGREFDIVCGQIDIGNAETPMTSRMSHGVLQPDGSLQPEPTFEVTNVAQAILYMDSLPLNSNVQFLTILASKMPFTGRG